MKSTFSCLNKRLIGPLVCAIGFVNEGITIQWNEIHLINVI